MTTRLRFEDFDAEGEQVFLGGRIIRTRDILSVAVQKRVSAAILGALLIAGLLLFSCFTAGSGVAILVGVPLAALVFVGAVQEWRHPYALILTVYQLGTFEVTGIPQTALPALYEFADSL